MISREEAKQMFRDDKDAYGKPRAIMSKIDIIYDSLEPVVKEVKISDLTFDNSHRIAELMYENLDIKVVEALMLDLEAQIRFRGKEN